ncbi:MAG: DUF5106 domain-containing protein [Prevotellaceae bacterium]|jgi:thiol-disulfide isomerase/thioredoxin|nr:DUF5106 domain-containing protein [Prevotellaceae bacterium]
MRTLFILFILTATGCGAREACAQNAEPQKSGYQIKFELKGEKNKDVILAIYYGSSKYSIDTAQLDRHGKAEFSGAKPLSPGMYLFASDGAQLFDFLISDTVNQNFTVFTTKGKLLETLSFDGSPENQAFADFTRFMADIQKTQQKHDLKNADSLQLQQYRDEEALLDKKTEDKVKEISEQYPKSLLSSIANAMMYPKPKTSELPADKSEQQRYIYKFMKTHYWDKLTLTDHRMQNTPILIPAIDNYFATIIPQIPDSIIHAIDKMLDKAQTDTAMTKFLVGHIFNKYLKMKTIMGMENVIIHLIDNYYLSGKVKTDDEKFMTSITEFADKNRVSLIGKQAQNLKMESLTGTPEALYDIDSPYTLVYIFEPSCGHCKVETPKIYKVFQEYKDKGLAGFCVYNLHNKEEWVEYIAANNFTDWINVWDPKNEADFRTAYSVYSVPQVYVLDKDKKIVGRGLESVSLAQLLAHLLKNK